MRFNSNPCHILRVAACASALLGSVANAQPAASPAPASSHPNLRMVNLWRVAYHDTKVGDVTGTAYVNWDKQTARVVVKSSTTGEEKSLFSNDVTLGGSQTDAVFLTLTGLSPSQGKILPPDVTEMKRCAAHEGKLAIATAGGAIDVPVRVQARADTNRVRVAMQEGNYGSLAGTWSYHADPLTGRDSQGMGRAGWFHVMSREEIDDFNRTAPVVEQLDGGFVGLQSDAEEWWPMPVEINAIAVVEDQLAESNTGPLYPAPIVEANRYAAQWDTPNLYTWRDDRSRMRTLLVVGRHLAFDKETPLGEFAGGLHTKSCHLLAHWGDPNLTEDQKKLFAIGWERVLRGKDEAAAAVSRQMEAALFTVELADDVMPGPQTFHWNETEHSWLVQFGNNTAVARFVRPLTEVTASDPMSTTTVEPATSFFLPERVAVEVQTRLKLPFDTLKVRIGLPGSEAVQIKEATRQPSDPTVYRTDFFLLAPAAAGTPEEPAKERVTPKVGDEVMATLDQKDLLKNSNFLFASVPSAKAHLLKTPGSAVDGQFGGLWKDALLHAATLANKQNLGYFELAGQKVETIGSIPITVGDHAAMLLLREAFVAKMQAQLDWLTKLRTDDDLDKFREWVEPYVLGDGNAFYAQPQAPYAEIRISRESLWFVLPPFEDAVFSNLNAGLHDLDAAKNLALTEIDALNEQRSLVMKALVAMPQYLIQGPPDQRRWGQGSAFARLAVSIPDGTKCPFYETFINPAEHTYRVFGGDRAKIRRWQLDTAKEAVLQYQEIVRAALANAKGILETDRAGLLKLTGTSFSSVVFDLLPRMMRLTDVGTPVQHLWVPDPAGRAAVMGLASTALSVAAGQDYSGVKDQLYLMIAQTALSLPAMASECALAQIVSLAGNVLIWEAGSLQRLVETHQGQEDVKLEFGYAIVLGPERLAEAEVKKSEWWETLASIAADGAFLAAQAHFDSIPKIEKDLAMFRGRKLMEKMEGPLSFRGLKGAQMDDVMVYLQDRAVALDRAVKAAAFDDVREMAEARRISRLARETGEVPVARLVPAEEDPFKTAPTRVSPPEPDVVDRFAATMRSASEGPPVVTVTQVLPTMGNPKENSWFFGGMLGDSGGPVHYRLGERLGGGSSAEVYEVLEVSGRPPFDREMVIKFVGNDDVIGNSEQQLTRMEMTERNLAHFEHEPIVEYHRPEPTMVKVKKITTDAKNVQRTFIDDVRTNKDYIIQAKVKLVDLKKVPLSELRDGDCVQIKMADISYEGSKYFRAKMPYSQVCKVFLPEMQRAVVRFYRQLGELGLVATDLSMPNIYFKKLGDKWIMGVLDIDYVTNYAEAPKNYTTVRVEELKFFRCVELPIASVTGSPLRTANQFMEGMMGCTSLGGNGRLPWVEFAAETNEIVPCLIHPDIVREFYPNFGEGLPPPLPKLPKESFWTPPQKSVRDWMERIRGLIRIPGGPPAVASAAWA